MRWIGKLSLFVFLLSTACQDSNIDASRFHPSFSNGPEEGPVPHVQTIAILPTFSQIEGIGKTLPLSLTLLLSDGTLVKEGPFPFPVKWTSLNEEVISVDASGEATSVSEGDAYITTEIDGKKAFARIYVTHENVASPSEPPNEGPVGDASTPYADRVVSFTQGGGGGFNRDKLPDIVLGPPKGKGQFEGSLDVLSLGKGGEIVLEFLDTIIVDKEGPDFIVFENAFQVGPDPQITFAEPAFVAVSDDGIHFFEFPCDPSGRPYSGCAGVHPVLANPDENNIDPTDPNTAGGDAFDLADVGLSEARFIRIRDAGNPNEAVGLDSEGFDLDAVAIVNEGLP